TTDTFLRWRKSSLPWKHNLDIGPTEMRRCAAYAQLLKTLCLDRRKHNFTSPVLPANGRTGFLFFRRRAPRNFTRA
ncbi:MAG: hypothetical protein WB460_05270, partial [Candidatus Acidiferrales bacterium]